MATALDSAFLSGFKTGGDVVNQGQQGAMNLLSRLQTQQQIQQEQAMLPIRQKLYEQQLEQSAAHTAGLIAQNNLVTEQKAGSAKFYAAVANVKRWDDPTDVAQVWNVIKDYPSLGVPGSPLPQFVDKLVESATYAKNRLDVAGVMHPEGESTKPTAIQQDLVAANKLDAEALELERAGNPEAAQKMRTDAAILRSAHEKPNTTVFDPATGKPLVQIGGKASTTGEATQATASYSQREYLHLKNAVPLLENLQKVLTASDVGSIGYLGELWDRSVGQLYPDMVGVARTKNRTELKATIEGLMRRMSEDTRFSNADRAEIKAMMPSLGILESPARAKIQLGKLTEILKGRALNYATFSKLPLSEWEWTIQNNDQALELVKEGKLTKQQAIDWLQKRIK